MVRKIKRLRKPAIILLILVIIAIIGWLVYRAFGPVVQEVWQILQSGNQSDLAEYIGCHYPVCGCLPIWLVESFPTMLAWFYCW